MDFPIPCFGQIRIWITLEIQLSDLSLADSILILSIPKVEVGIFESIPVDLTIFKRY